MGVPDNAGTAESREADAWVAYRSTRAPALRERLFDTHTNFARNIARRLHREQSRGDLEVGDLCHFAYVGLLESIERFNPDRGVPFRAFAAPRIMGSIRDGIARSSELREQISWNQRLRRERARSLMQPSPGAAEGSDPMTRLVEFATGLALGFMLEGTGLAAEEIAEAGGTAYESLAWKDTIGRLHRELDALPDREAAILRHHYIYGVAFDEIATLMGVTKGRISQLHKAALGRLRKKMTERGHFRLER